MGLSNKENPEYKVKKDKPNMIRSIKKNLLKQ